jgi:biopolymer transport protein ExbB/TolQ
MAALPPVAGLMLASLVAAALILAQGCAVVALLRFVKSFGRYVESQREMTAAILAMQESNLALHHTNLKVLEALQKLEPHAQKVVA